MEGVYTQVPFGRTISPANAPTKVATIADMPRDSGSLIVKGKRERK